MVHREGAESAEDDYSGHLNPKSETRSTKQIQMIKITMTKPKIIMSQLINNERTAMIFCLVLLSPLF
jgi:hypothetical protein